MLYGWFARIMNRPQKVNAVALVQDREHIENLSALCYNQIVLTQKAQEPTVIITEKFFKNNVTNTLSLPSIYYRAR